MGTVVNLVAKSVDFSLSTLFRILSLLPFFSLARGIMMRSGAFILGVLMCLIHNSFPGAEAHEIDGLEQNYPEASSQECRSSPDRITYSDLVSPRNPSPSARPARVMTHGHDSAENGKVKVVVVQLPEKDVHGKSEPSSGVNQDCRSSPDRITYSDLVSRQRQDSAENGQVKVIVVQLPEKNGAKDERSCSRDRELAVCEERQEKTTRDGEVVLKSTTVTTKKRSASKEPKAAEEVEERSKGKNKNKKNKSGKKGKSGKQGKQGKR